MSKVSDEHIGVMLAGLEGVTPGPWDEAAGLVRAIDGDAAIPIFETREPWKKHRRISTVVKQEWHNRHHVARCDPDTIRSLLMEVQSLRAENERLRADAYKDELLKIAADVGEPDDPFAAWEAIAALKAKLEDAAKVLEPFAMFTDWPLNGMADDTPVSCRVYSASIGEHPIAGFGLRAGEFRAAKSFLANLKGAE